MPPRRWRSRTGITAVVDAVRRGTPPIRMEEGPDLQVLIDALYRSAELGREVTVEPVDIKGGYR